MLLFELGSVCLPRAIFRILWRLCTHLLRCCQPLTCLHHRCYDRSKGE
jgi:hypothetical protein